MLPASRHFRKQPIHPRAMLASYAAHAKNPMQRALYLLGFLFMGSLVATYNYLGYRLIAPPFSLSHTLIGLLFTIYLVGIASSTYAGRLADSFGRPVILIASIVTALAGLLVMSIDQVAAVIAGLMIFTGGFFAAHSVASGWVGANATSSKAQASSLYLFFYYSGGALFGWAGGLFWEVLQWEGVTLMVGTILTIALLTAIYLRRCAIAKAGVVWTRDG
jgi:YNFM family putative membrane transporter